MKDLPYTVRIHKSKQREAEAWCHKTLGKRWSITDNREGKWSCFWAGFRQEYPGYDFHFANERDMFWFALKYT